MVENTMNENTKERYRKLAANFYNTKIEGDVTAQKISNALVDNAEEYRPNYFTRLKSALAFDQSEKGYKKAVKKIKETVNPVTVKGSNLVKKSKLKRVKSVPESDYRKMLNEAKKTDNVMRAAIMLSYELGCRPVELFDIKILENGNIFIKGAKKSKGTRGLDREIQVIETETIKRPGLVSAIILLQVFKKETIDCKCEPHELLQARLASLSRRVFKRRKTFPSFYSMRHQMGSNLKASGMDRKEIAYIMGHQSSSSVDVYGNKRSGNSKIGIKAGVSSEAISAVVREKHTSAPAPAAAPVDGGGFNM